MERKKSAGIGAVLGSIIVLMIAILGILLIFVSYTSFYEKYTDICADKLSSIVHIASANTTVETLDEYFETGEETEEISRFREQLINIREAVPDINFLYVYKVDEDYKGYTYLFDINIPDENEAEFEKLGGRYEFIDKDLTDIVPSLKEGKASEGPHITYDYGYGVSITAWYPIFDEDGTARYFVEADMFVESAFMAVAEYMKRVIMIFALCLVVIVVVQLILVRGLVIKPIEELTSYAESYKDGEFTASPFVRKNHDELARLADSFGVLDKQIKDHVEKLMKVTAERERIGTELDLARTIQASSLPNIFPPFPEYSQFELYATMNPAKEVGGDFYDFFMIDDDHLALVIADVSGKGVGAALFMMISKVLIDSQSAYSISPAKILEDVNKRLCKGNEAEMFVTVWLGVLNIKTGVLTAANAGHEYPAVKKANGDFELYKDKHGFVLGGMDMARYKEYEIQLEKGDMLYVYTDGVAEATNAENELYGTERMLKALNASKDKEVEQLLKDVRSDIDAFVKEAPQFDDITMLGLRFQGE